MIQIAVCLRRLPHLSREEFQRYWREVHGPLIAKHSPSTRVRRYVQVHTLEVPLLDKMRIERGTTEPFDGIAELCWDDLNKLDPTPERVQALKEIIEDEHRFIDLSRSSLLIGEEHVFID
jgi:uncharacterized protein (TIGR02118 family)